MKQSSSDTVTPSANILFPHIPPGPSSLRQTDPNGVAQQIGLKFNIEQYQIVVTSVTQGERKQGHVGESNSTGLCFFFTCPSSHMRSKTSGNLEWAVLRNTSLPVFFPASPQRRCGGLSFRPAACEAPGYLELGGGKGGRGTTQTEVHLPYIPDELNR